jgi:agmatinase
VLVRGTALNGPPTWSGVLHAGVHGFLRAALIRPVATELAAVGATHAVYGIPFDSTTLYRTGSMHGPKAVRDASAQFVSYHYDYDLDLAEHIRLVDCGDAAAVPGNAARTLDIAQADLEEIYSAGAVPVILGGEHTVTIAGTRALAARGCGALGLVVFDTHLDTATDIGGEELSYCAPVSRTLDLQAYPPGNAVIVGVHGPANPREERRWAEEHGVRVFSMAEIERRGVVEVTRAAMAIAWNGTAGVYVSIDIDCLDAAGNPGGAPEPGGLTSRELFAALREVAAAGYSAFDVVEVAPQYDPAGITATTACRVVLDLLAAGAARDSGSL